LNLYSAFRFYSLDVIGNKGRHWFCVR